MKRMLITIMLVLMLCVSANADIVYTTDGGTLGVIQVSSATSADLTGAQYTYSGADAEPLLGSYWDGSASRIILVNRTTDTTTSGDTALIFNPSDMTTPTEKTLHRVYNTQHLAGSHIGRALFAVSGATITEFGTGDFQRVRSYTYTPASSDTYTPEITSVITGTNTVYCLVDREDELPQLLAFDGQLTEDTQSFSRTTLSSDATALAWLSSSRIAIAHSKGVDVLYRGVSRILSTDNPVKAVCQDKDSGFYFVEQSTSSNDITTSMLRHYAINSDIITTNTLYTSESANVSIIRDENHGVLAAIMGDRILIYNMEDDLLTGEYSGAVLGGLPLGIATTTTSGDDGKSSSGCNFAGAGALMLAACAFLKRR